MPWVLSVSPILPATMILLFINLDKYKIIFRTLSFNPKRSEIEEPEGALFIGTHRFVLHIGQPGWTGDTVSCMAWMMMHSICDPVR